MRLLWVYVEELDIRMEVMFCKSASNCNDDRTEELILLDYKEDGRWEQIMY